MNVSRRTRPRISTMSGRSGAERVAAVFAGQSAFHKDDTGCYTSHHLSSSRSRRPAAGGIRLTVKVGTSRAPVRARKKTITSRTRTWPPSKTQKTAKTGDGQGRRGHGQGSELVARPTDDFFQQKIVQPHEGGDRIPGRRMQLRGGKRQRARRQGAPRPAPAFVFLPASATAAI